MATYKDNSTRGNPAALKHLATTSNAFWKAARRMLLIATVVLGSLPLTGFLYQASASALQATSYPASGKLIDVGGYHLYLDCMGTSRPGSPTVILDEGLAATSLGWSKVQPGVASFARVCSYDRAGYGRSDTG